MTSCRPCCSGLATPAPSVVRPIPAWVRSVSAVFWADLRAGKTMTASYVPTVMAVGLISGLGPLAGLWCDVIVGTITGVCGSTRVLVCGPRAVLAVITATLIVDNDMGP
ncbi:MAG: SulP family inorganic anion transporter [Paracoccaceae bacterium]|nr:SulP family inorganic anion transporter [Paracoccaceae bacterium]